MQQFKVCQWGRGDQRGCIPSWTASGLPPPSTLQSKHSNNFQSNQSYSQFYSDSFKSETFVETTGLFLFISSFNKYDRSEETRSQWNVNAS